MTAGVLLCLAIQTLPAQESAYPGSTIIDSDQTFAPQPLIIRNNTAGLAFDLGGSDVQKLQFQLSQPLSIQNLSSAAPNSRGLVMAGSSLNYELDENLSLAAGATLGQADAGFQTVGSIHCENGTLDAVSYRASNCYFVDDRDSSRISVVNLGARYQLGGNASAGVNMFHSESNFNSTYRPGNSLPGSNVVLDPLNLGLTPGNPLFSDFDPAAGAQEMDSQLTGIDLEFQVGISTDQAGDMIVGLQLTRVLDGNYQAAYQSIPGIQNWTIADPYDSARLSFDWYKGPFSGGIQTYYREQVDFLGRSSLESYGTFDVHFSWRAPWNASLSVGTRNVLNAGTDENRQVPESSLADPFESVYGRIPYVRYKQDL